MKIFDAIPSQPVVLDDELRESAYLCGIAGESIEKKNNSGIPESIYTRIEVDTTDKDKISHRFNWLFPRLKGHIQRLCSNNRTAAENLFGLAVVLYYTDPESYDDDILPDCAKEEFKTTPWWWSVSPYILSKLQSEGYPTEIVYKAICEWGKRAEQMEDPLPGLEDDLEYFGVQSLILSSDPNHISHKYAKALADNVISKAEDFKPFRN